MELSFCTKAIDVEPQALCGTMQRCWISIIPFGTSKQVVPVQRVAKKTEPHKANLASIITHSSHSFVSGYSLWLLITENMAAFSMFPSSHWVCSIGQKTLWEERKCHPNSAWLSSLIREHSLEGCHLSPWHLKVNLLEIFSLRHEHAWPRCKDYTHSTPVSANSGKR